LAWGATILGITVATWYISIGANRRLRLLR